MRRLALALIRCPGARRPLRETEPETPTNEWATAWRSTPTRLANPLAQLALSRPPTGRYRRWQ